MIMKAAISSKTHPEYGHATIPFPIPDSEYDHTIDLLEDMGIGTPTARDCHVDRLDSEYPILNRLTAQSVNVDELDYLAKRLESFCSDESAKFQAMASKLCLSDIQDFINLTFCCQQATVITDFSDLEQIGKGHALTVGGGSMPVEMLETLDYHAVALDLIQRGVGAVTPYGVVYDNGMKLEQVYDGRHFPAYLYEMPQMMIEIKSGPKGGTTGCIYLPCPDKQLQRTLERAGSGLEGARLEIAMDELPPQVSAVINLTRDGLEDLNGLCRTVEALDEAERTKLEAVIEMAQPEYASEIIQLAENLDQFDFIPRGNTPSAREQVTELGCVAYHGSLALEALMGSPRESRQRRAAWGEEPQRNERVLSEGQDKRYEACGDEMKDVPAEQYQHEMGGLV